MPRTRAPLETGDERFLIGVPCQSYSVTLLLSVARRLCFFCCFFCFWTISWDGNILFGRSDTGARRGSFPCFGFAVSAADDTKTVDPFQPFLLAHKGNKTCKEPFCFGSCSCGLLLFPGAKRARRGVASPSRGILSGSAPQRVANENIYTHTQKRDTLPATLGRVLFNIQT